jgi:hypothetical protein
MVPRQYPRVCRALHLRIQLRGKDGAMTEKVLNVADVHPFFEEEGRNGMAEHVRGQLKSKARSGDVFAQHGSNRLFREAVA